ncbi:MAG: sigma-70 family RNA polymerase sigma factor [Sedimentisphaerales bacterium]|nr:sigma-70 family RNA polymerase sigma factor [Sedimentisphaerales bacterium]
MLEEKLLIWRFKCGDGEALCRIYRKYRTDLLKLAALLLHTSGDAEDAVHDVFVSFAQSADRLKLHGSLKGYLLTCVANNARNRNRARQRRRTVGLDEAEAMVSDSRTPEQWITYSEELRKWADAMARLPYEQREVVTLHVTAGMKFGRIAQCQGVSVNTVKGRYRYALEKLRSIVNGELEP